MEKVNPEAKPMRPDAVQDAIEKLMASDCMTLIVAMEFGYLACEAGLNLEAARAKFLACIK